MTSKIDAEHHQNTRYFLAHALRRNCANDLSSQYKKLKMDLTYKK